MVAPTWGRFLAEFESAFGGVLLDFGVHVWIKTISNCACSFPPAVVITTEIRLGL